MPKDEIVSPAVGFTDTRENRLIKVITALDALGLEVVAVKDARGCLVIKAFDKAEPEKERAAESAIPFGTERPDSWSLSW
jgi:hypothetical protein